MKRHIIAGLMLVAFGAHSQYVLKEADSQYELYNYSKAAELYNVAYKKKNTFYNAFRLAESYRRSFDYAKAEQWYATALSAQGATPEARLQYALILQNNGKFAQAKQELEKYSSEAKDADPERLKNWKASADSAATWISQPSAATVINRTELNTNAADWAPVQYSSGIVFTSDRDAKNVGDATGKHKPFLRFDGRTIPPSDKVYLWTGKNYNHLYYKNENNELSVFPLNPGTNYHVGTSSFTANGKEMFFTLTRIPESIKRKEKLNTINVEIYSSKKDSAGKWSAPVGLPFNKVSEYSVGDPFITKNGDTLYFSSNMQGGKGGTDLYRSVKSANGGWGSPENLSALNTAGNERSPVADGNGNFYFASDGRVGLGGLDIFLAKNDGASEMTIKNFGHPINSVRDDFAFTPADGGTLAYLSSNREGGSGADDIYSFDLGKVLLASKPVEVVQLSGIVYDQATKMPISNAIVSLGENAGIALQAITASDGSYGFSVKKSQNYTIRANAQGYAAGEATLQTDTALNYKKDLYLVATGQKEIVLKPIYYDFDKYNIRPDAAKELDRLVSILNDNAGLAIILGSHTDSRGVDAYNLWLSQKRAESAVKYLEEHGIAKDRLTARGYGETRLVNRCANGVKCSVPQHQANRRTEFKIKK